MHILSAADTPVCGNYSAAGLSRTGCRKYTQLRHMAKPPLLAPPFPDNPRFLPQETKKLFHPLQLRQSLLTATVWKSAPDASA